MAYDPAFPRAHYDGVADKEWTRLTRNRRGELNYLVHMDVLGRHITGDMDVLEIGAGAGIYTKELVHIARRLVVSDLSEVQLALNRDHMRGECEHPNATEVLGHNRSLRPIRQSPDIPV